MTLFEFCLAKYFDSRIYIWLCKKIVLFREKKTWTQSKCNLQASLAQMMWCTYMTSCCAKFFTRGSSSKHINISTHLIEVIYDQFQPQQAFLCESKPDRRALHILNVRSYSYIIKVRWERSAKFKVALMRCDIQHQRMQSRQNWEVKRYCTELNQL